MCVQRARVLFFMRERGRIDNGFDIYFWCQTIMVVRKSCFATSKVIKNVKWNVRSVATHNSAVGPSCQNTTEYTRNNFDWSTRFICLQWLQHTHRERSINQMVPFPPKQQGSAKAITQFVSFLYDMRLTFHDRFDHAKPHRIVAFTSIITWI